MAAGFHSGDKENSGALDTWRDETCAMVNNLLPHIGLHRVTNAHHWNRTAKVNVGLVTSATTTKTGVVLHLQPQSPGAKKTHTNKRAQSFEPEFGGKIRAAHVNYCVTINTVCWHWSLMLSADYSINTFYLGMSNYKKSSADFLIKLITVNHDAFQI